MVVVSDGCVRGVGDWHVWCSRSCGEGSSLGFVAIVVDGVGCSVFFVVDEVLCYIGLMNRWWFV